MLNFGITPPPSKNS
uniref:Uncharacterized protein n=1 Tax=Medicago truncatula TaxID=3880 RepID=I3SU28_MEDTR|nr:unknown [Medicago truncatula]